MTQPHSPASRCTLVASVLGSGAGFLESSVVNVALPAMGRDLGLAKGYQLASPLLRSK